MKIKSINIQNNKVLGNLFLDFTNDSGEIINSIIIAGENGTGKSTILNIIYEFSQLDLVSTDSSEKREFVVQFSEEEITQLKQNDGIKRYIGSDIKDREFIFKFDFSIINNWNQIKIVYHSSDDSEHQTTGNVFSNSNAKKVIRAIYSDVEINFNSRSINSVTSKNIDEDFIQSKRSQNDLATEVTQLLVDIQALDAEDFMQWGISNTQAQVDERMLNIRMKRFKSAFEYIFENKKYVGVVTENGKKNVMFEEYGKKIPLEKLSSGEKQIIFRGGFLLKDKKSSEGAIALIDEPEISLHPTWQLKILDYYKRLFYNDKNVQTSQIFFVTHSPFIIHNRNRIDDKVFILKKDNSGNTISLKDGKFYTWDEEKIVEKAFDLTQYRKYFNQESTKALVITEGSTDWKHMKAAYSNLKEKEEYSDIFDNLEFEFFEYEPLDSPQNAKYKLEMGWSNLCSMCENFAKMQQNRKFIFISDRDEEKANKKLEVAGQKYKNWGNNVFSFVLPVPETRKRTPNICIEHLYSDSEIKTVYTDDCGIERRLYMGNEFDERGISVTLNRYCIKKDICGSEKISIIEGSSKDRVTGLISDEDKNFALSKMTFANKILNNEEPFNQFDFSNFISVFRIIKEIVEL